MNKTDDERRVHMFSCSFQVFLSFWIENTCTLCLVSISLVTQNDVSTSKVKVPFERVALWMEWWEQNLPFWWRMREADTFVCVTESMIWHSLSSGDGISHSHSWSYRFVRWIARIVIRVKGTKKDPSQDQEKWWLRIIASLEERNEREYLRVNWVSVKTQFGFALFAMRCFVALSLSLPVTDSSQVQSFERLVFYFLLALPSSSSSVRGSLTED